MGSYLYLNVTHTYTFTYIYIYISYIYILKDVSKQEGAAVVSTFDRLSSRLYTACLWLSIPYEPKAIIKTLRQSLRSLCKWRD